MRVKELCCELFGHRPPRDESGYMVETPSRLARMMRRISAGRQRTVSVTWTCPRCRQQASAVWEAKKWGLSPDVWVSGRTGQKFFRWNLAEISPKSRLGALRACALGIVLRGLCRLGVPVLIVGCARSGKTALLERTCPGKVLNNRERYMANGYRPVAIELGPESNAVIGIDDGEMLDVGWARRSAETLRKRHVLYAFQSMENAFHAGMPTVFPGRRLLVVALGWHQVLQQNTY